jgi:protein TonB
MQAMKTEKANLENKRFIFLQLGMIIALALVLLAFSWKTYDISFEQIYTRRVLDIPDEMIPITEQKEPEPPKQRPPEIVSTINIVDDETDVDDILVIDAGADESTAIPDYIPVATMEQEEDIEDGNEVFMVVESSPSFPGGDAKMYEYLAKNTRYPQPAKEAGIQGYRRGM